MNIAQWKKFLVKHPNRALVNFFISSISQGFRLGFTTPYSHSSQHARILFRHMSIHAEVEDEYLAAEIAQSRIYIVGPFEKLFNSEAHISRFGVIPKKY